MAADSAMDAEIAMVKDISMDMDMVVDTVETGITVTGRLAAHILSSLSPATATVTTGHTPTRATAPATIPWNATKKATLFI